MNPRDRLQYALYLQRLHDIFVLKENIAFEYKHKHYNKAAAQIDKEVDKCLDNNIKAVVDGTHNLETPNLDHVITEALGSQQKMLVKTEDKYIQSAVEQNTKQYTSFIQNRIEKENISLQAKIKKEYQKEMYKDIPEEEAKKILTEKFKGHARKRSKNIVKDALHTNESQIAWTYNLNNGMKYKVWMNGQSKSGVRSWHIKSKIQPVEIDDFFDIFGPTGHAPMMYPGDLNGGAENVANCKCWLYYTNIAPSNLKKKGTIQVNPNVKLENENATTFSANTDKKGLFTKIKNKIEHIPKKLEKIINLSNDNGDRYNGQSKPKSLKPQKDKDNNKSLFSKINDFLRPNEKSKIGHINVVKAKKANYLTIYDIDLLLSDHPYLFKYVEEIRISSNKNEGVPAKVDRRKPTVIKVFNEADLDRTYYEILIHEAAHVLDHTIGDSLYNISNSDDWKKAYDLDKEHITNDKKLDLKEKNDYFVSHYAETHFNKYKDHVKEDRKKYSEDFAESVRRYLDPTDTEFRKKFPNRCEVLEQILGV